MEIILDGINGSPVTNQSITNKTEVIDGAKIKPDPLAVVSSSPVKPLSGHEDQVVLQAFPEIFEIKINLVSSSGDQLEALVTLKKNLDEKGFLVMKFGDKMLLEGSDSKFTIQNPPDFLYKWLGKIVTLDFLTKDQSQFLQKISDFAKDNLPLQDQNLLLSYRDWQGFFLLFNDKEKIKVFTRKKGQARRWILVISDEPLIVLEIFLPNDSNPALIKAAIKSKNPLSAEEKRLLLCRFTNIIPGLVVRFDHLIDSLHEILVKK